MALGAAARFVRDVLGCECPADVLERVSIQHDRAALGGLPLRFSLDVGGRLLVCVTEASSPGEVAPALAGVAREGLALRDAGGFRRLRFVIAARDPGALRAGLPAAFAGADDRLHLHVVDARDLPF